jgi:hypothetical protein
LRLFAPLLFARHPQLRRPPHAGEFSVCRSVSFRASFFSLITSPEGNTIEKYTSLGELPGENSGVINLQLRRNSDMRFSARMFCLQTSAGRMIATVLIENGSSI